MCAGTCYHHLRQLPVLFCHADVYVGGSLGKCGVLRSVANGGEAKSLLAIGEIFEDELTSRITGGSLQAVVYTDGNTGDWLTRSFVGNLTANGDLRL